jgi:hypothetical protein
MSAPRTRVEGARRGGLVGGLLLAATVVALLAPFLGADPSRYLTTSDARDSDEGFNLANARQRVLFGEFATGDVDRSLTNGAYSAIAAAVFGITEPKLAVGLAEPLGVAAALLAAAALAGANLALEYGRLGMTEPTVVAFLTGGFVLAVRAVRRRSPLAGAGCGSPCGSGRRSATRARRRASCAGSTSTRPPRTSPSPAPASCCSRL